MPTGRQSSEKSRSAPSDPAAVTEHTRHLLSISLADSTKKMYGVGWKSYVQYCATANRKPLLLTEEALMNWASSTALSGCKHSTIKSYLSGIRSTAIMQGFDVSDLGKMQRLKLVLRALKSIAPHTATRLPITNDTLLKIRPHMKLDTYEGKVMWAAFTFAHSCLMRCGEFTTRSYKERVICLLVPGSGRVGRSMEPSRSLVVKHQRSRLTFTFVQMAVLRARQRQCHST